MRILVSNDDGILAPGVAALGAAAGEIGDVTIIAPDSPQSASGHAITLHRPLTARRISVDGEFGFDGISVDGRPADCVRLAIRHLLDAPPQLVLSGINASPNVGINVFYSGTVAAAGEAAMFGIPAVAFSTVIGEEVNFARSARLCVWVLRRLLQDGLGPGDLVNVNIPELTDGNPRGVRVVRQSTAPWQDFYDREDGDDSGTAIYRLASDAATCRATGENSDVVALEEGYITVTPLHVDMTRHDRLDALSQLAWDQAPQ